MNGKHRIVLALSLGWLLLTAGSTALSAEPGQTKVADKSAILIPSFRPAPWSPSDSCSGLARKTTPAARKVWPP